MKETHGKDVLPTLAERYQQLYLIPGDEGAEQYKAIVRRGEAAENKSLSHFKRNDRDSLAIEETPAGSVQIVTLHERADFELFLQIMAHRCVPTPIPASEGAMLLSGVANWRKVREYLAQFSSEQRMEAFQRFTADKANYTDALIVLSTGPYSGVGAEHYVGGRLENYVDAPDDAEKTRRLDAFAPVLHGILGKFENNALEQRGIPPLELSLIYESGYDELWKRKDIVKS